MTKEEINIEISKILGWEYRFLKTSSDGIDIYEHLWVRGNPPMDNHNIQYSSDFTITLPRFCDDLNAMNSAERTLTKEQLSDYNDNLASEVAGYDVREVGYVSVDIHPQIAIADAYTRAKAFLKTMDISLPTGE